MCISDDFCKGQSTVNCKYLPTLDNLKKYCYTSGTDKCNEQIYNCEDVPYPSKVDCSEFPTKKNSGCAYLPINGKAKCIEYPYCNDVTLLEHNTHNYECYQYPVSNKLLYKCEIDETNKDHPCKEVLKYSCSDVPEIPSNSNAKCKYFPVSINSNETHTCTSDNNGRCKEEYKCNKVPKGENIDCSSYPVSDDFAYIV